MGVVWLATDTVLRRSVALKLGKAGARIPDEGVSGANLMHPNVIAVFDVTEDDSGRKWLVMEHLPSRSLRTIRHEDGPLPPAKVAGIGAQIASALAHLHAKGMVHRDVTPANVLVTADGTAKLADFGIATWDRETLTEDPKTGGGTPGFQAPEVTRGNRATTESDMYSLGATLETALEGSPSAGAGPTAPLRAVLNSLMDQEPRRRPTAEQAQRLLADLAGARSRRTWWIAAAAVVLVIGLVLWWAGPLRPAGRPTPSTSAAGDAATSVMGDPRTADPCALTYANALATYGAVEPRDDYGNFNRCDVLVFLTTDRRDDVDVQVELVVHQQESGVPVQQVGAIGLQRPPADPDGCGRVLLLQGDYQVSVYAQEHGTEKVDLCGMAEAVTSSALVTLNAGQIPRRVLPTSSLASKDACALLDTATVTATVGPGLVAQPGFARWECAWKDSGGARPVKVVFDQNKVGVGETADGTPVRFGGYSGRLLPPDGSDTDCEVDLVYRTYTDSTGENTADVARVKVDNGEPAAQLCTMAQRLAATVAQRLGS